MPDTESRARVILVVVADAAMQDSVRVIIEAAGCTPLVVPTIAHAKKSLCSTKPVLILIDPVWRDGAASQLGAEPPIVEIPVRTSSTGVRRVAKRGAPATRWLQNLIAKRCSAAD